MSARYAIYKGLMLVTLVAATLGVNPADAIACGITITEDITLQQDLTGCEGDGIIVAADDLTIDLNGYSVTGLRKERTSGIRLWGVDGVTVKNGTVAGFERGLYLYDTTWVLVQDVAVNANRYEGLMAYRSSGLSVLDSSFTNNTRSAIWVYDSDAEVIGNVAVDNPNRSYYVSGGRITLSQNIARGGSYYSAFTVADGYTPANYSFGGNRAEGVTGVGYLFAWGFSGSVNDLGDNLAVDVGSVACWTEKGVECPLDLTASSSGSICGDDVCELDESAYSCSYDCGLPPSEACEDGIDNDGDGATDCDDADDCALDPACEPAPACEPPGASCDADAECCSQECRRTGRGKTAARCT